MPLLQHVPGATLAMHVRTANIAVIVRSRVASVASASERCQAKPSLPSKFATNYADHDEWVVSHLDPSDLMMHP
jgi:hypothetical protein